MHTTQNEILTHLLKKEPAPETPLASFSVRKDILIVSVSTFRWCEFYLTPAPELAAVWKSQQGNALDEGQVYRFLHSIKAREIIFTDSAGQSASFLDVPIKTWSFFHLESGRFAALVHSAHGDGLFLHQHQPAWYHRTDALGLKSWSSYLEHQLEFTGQEVGPVWNYWIRDRAKPKALWRYQGEMAGRPLEAYKLTTNSDLAGDRKHLYCDTEGILWCPITGKPLEPYYLS